MIGFILISTLLNVINAYNCPSSESIQPCICQPNTQTLNCLDINQNFSISQITENAFKDLGKIVEFKSVKIINTSIDQIEENDFKHIVIKYWLTISWNKNLKTINSKALRNLKVETLDLDNNSLEYQEKNNTNIFQAFSNSSIGYLELMNNKISIIPSFAFKTITKMEEIYLNSNCIELIAKNAFSFNDKSESMLEIFLEMNNLNETAFEIGSLQGMNRPTMIHLAANNIKYLGQNIFEPYFNENPKNTMNMDRNPTVCDCRMKWLVDRNIKTKNLMEKQLYGIICNNLNKTSIWQISYDIFKDC